MAYHSYIEFRGARRLEADGALDVLANTLGVWAGREQGALASWLMQTSKRWVDHIAGMPPGLRDLVLDADVKTDEQREYLSRAIREVQEEGQKTRPAFLASLCNDVLEVLGEKSPTP